MADYETKVLESLARLETKMNSVCDKQRDHEKRIRFLEKGIWIAIGFLVVADIVARAMLK